MQSSDYLQDHTTVRTAAQLLTAHLHSQDALVDFFKDTSARYAIYSRI